MVRYDGTHLVIDIECGNWDTPKEARSEIMKALLFMTCHLDPDINNGNLDEVWHVCNMLENMVDEE